MTTLTLVAALLALIWGVFWAFILQCSPIGRWLAHQRTWLTVVIGVGVDLLILALVLPLDLWLAATAVVAASSIGLLARSGWNEYRAQQAALDAVDRRRGD